MREQTLASGCLGGDRAPDPKQTLLKLLPSGTHSHGSLKAHLRSSAEMEPVGVAARHGGFTLGVLAQHEDQYTSTAAHPAQVPVTLAITAANCLPEVHLAP